MEIGKLNKRIIIQKLTTTKSENNFSKESWVYHKTVWAAVSNLFGTEFWSAKADKSEKTVKFGIRYIKDLDSLVNEEKDKTTKLFRIKFGNSTFNINFIDNIKYRNTFMEIKAIEVV